MTKRIIALILLILLALMLLGCGASDGSELNPEAKQAADDIIRAVKEKLEYEAKLAAAKAKEAAAKTVEQKKKYAEQAKEYQEKIDELKSRIDALEEAFNKFKDILSPAQWLQIYNYFTSQYKKILGG